MESDIMKKRNKMKKGQAAIEFILLVVVMLLFINTAIITNATTASEAALDVSKIGKARLAAEKIVDSINYVGFSGVGTKQTLAVFIPENVSLKCTSSSSDPGYITFGVALEGTTGINDPPGDDGTGCSGTDPKICIKTIPVFSDLALECNPGIALIEGPTVANYVIAKIPSTGKPKVTVNFG